MNSTIKKIALSLLITLALFTGSIICFAGETAEPQIFTQDGIETQLVIDKEQYKEGEPVEVNVRVRNLNTFDIKDVTARMLLPNGFQTDSPDSIEKPLLSAGEETNMTLTLTKSTNPITGENLKWGLIFLILLGVSLLIVFLTSNKKMRIKALSIILCFAIVLPLLTNGLEVLADSLTGNKYSVTKVFSVDGHSYEIHVNVTYGELMKEGVTLESVTPSTGSFGSVLSLAGTGFTSTTKIIFKSDALGEVEVTPTINENGELRVVSPTLYIETVKIFAVQDEFTSNEKDFTVVGLPKPEGNEFQEFTDTFDLVFVEFEHELENVYTTTEMSGALAEQQSMINELQEALAQDVTAFNSSLTPEDQELICQIYGSEAFQDAQAKLAEAAELLSHSTTSEALSNISKTKEIVDTLIGVLREIKDVLHTVQWAAVATSAALAVISVFTCGATASAAAKAADIALKCKRIINELLNPAILGLTAVSALLGAAPTVAVKESLTTADYEGDIGINQYFGSLDSGTTNPIKSLASYAAVFGTLQEARTEATDLLRDADESIDDICGYQYQFVRRRNNATIQRKMEYLYMGRNLGNLNGKRFYFV